MASHSSNQRLIAAFIAIIKAKVVQQTLSFVTSQATNCPTDKNIHVHAHRLRCVLVGKGYSLSQSQVVSVWQVYCV